MQYADVPKLSTWINDTKTLRQSVGKVLTAIDEDIGKYAQAFSAMAKRNLLADLQRSLTAWERIQGYAVAMHPAYVALKKVVARKVSELSPTAFTYTHVICVGWCVGCSDPVFGDEFRFTNKDSGDMRGKCHEMMHAIRSAASALQLSGLADTDKTLKVFLAPEFYFRGANSAYPPELVSEIIPTMQKLGTSKDVWKHWLFVFGTAVSAHEDTISYCTVCNSAEVVRFVPDPTRKGRTVGRCTKDPTHAVAEGQYGAEVQNVALIQKGTDTHLVAKEYVSDIDYQSGVMVQYGKKGGAKRLNSVAPAGSQQGRIKSKFDDERMGGCIFTVDGITVGLEVCLDHAHTKQTPMSGGRLAGYADKVQILLIPSYGMEIRTGLYCMKGGVVFNVDGRGNGSSDVAVKGSTAPLTKMSYSMQKARGTIDLWGPFPIPRHGR
jgi:hypothetical protein